MSIVKKGFISPDIHGWIEKHRKENAEYFALCEEVSEFGQEIMLSLEIHNKYIPEILAASLLTRGMSNFQGIILLVERGMISEAQILARCLIEVMFAVTAIARDKGFAFDLVRNDPFERKRLLNAVVRNRHLGKQDLQRAEEELISVRQEIKSTGIKEMSIRDIAERADCIQTYDSTYKALSSTIHVSIRRLQDYLERSDDKIRSLLWGPHTRGLDLILLTAVDTLLKVLDAVLKVFSVDFRHTLELLRQRFNKMWEVFEQKDELDDSI